MASPLRLSAALIDAAEKEGAIQKRSVPKQIEFWAELGKAVERVIDPTDAVALIKGFRTIKVEPAESTPVDPRDVFDSLEASRKKDGLAGKVTSAWFYYEASSSRPGFLDRVDARTGERRTGQFQNGEFKVRK
jgi:hypothetical protein